MIPPVLQVVAHLAGNHPRITSRIFIRRSPYSFGALSVLDRRCPPSPNVILGGSDLVSWTGVYLKPVLRVFSPTVGGVPSPVERDAEIRDTDSRERDSRKRELERKIDGWPCCLPSIFLSSSPQLHSFSSPAQISKHQKFMNQDKCNKLSRRCSAINTICIPFKTNRYCLKQRIKRC